MAMYLYIIDTDTFVVAANYDEAVDFAVYNGYRKPVEDAIREDIQNSEEFGWLGFHTFTWTGWRWKYDFSNRSGCIEHRHEPFMVYC